MTFGSCGLQFYENNSERVEGSVNREEVEKELVRLNSS